LKTFIRSKITVKQCGNCRHWKSLNRVKDDPRGYCHQGSDPKAMGRFSLGCDNTIILPLTLFDKEAYPHYIPRLDDDPMSENPEDPSIPAD